MKREADLVIPVLAVLNESESGVLTTTQIRQLVKDRIALSEDDLLPLRNRNDRRIDQVIRNIKCHREVVGNPFAKGLLEARPRGMAITKKGRKYLSS